MEVVKGEQIYNNMEDDTDPRNGEVMTLAEKREKHYNYINACSGNAFGIEDLRDYIKQEYDMVTDMMILDQHEYEGVSVRLTAKDQRNYSELLRLATDGLLTYPNVTRDGIELSDQAETIAFVNGCSAFIMTVLTIGYSAKAGIDAMDENDLLNYIDAR